MANSTQSALELFGSDISVGNNFQASVAANGTLVLCSGCYCAVQMVALRLFVLLGSLFYDTEFGSLVLHWIREESTPATREALCVEIEVRLNDDPHIVPGTVHCFISAWDHNGVDLDLSFTLIDQTHPEHLLLRLGEENNNLTVGILKSARPRAL